MKTNVSKYLPVAIASFALMSGVHAEDKRGGHPQNCMDLCYAGPRITCDDNWEVDAAAVYQQVAVQGGEIALMQDAGSNRQSIAYPINATGVVQPSDFGWGFKVGLGYRNLIENWRFAARYSYLNITSNSGYETGYNAGYLPAAYTNTSLFTVASPVSPFTSGTSSQVPIASPQTNFFNVLFQNLQMGNATAINNVNFTMERPSMITSSLEMTPYYGVSATILTRRQVQTYSNDYVPQLAASTPGFYDSANGAYFQNYQKFNWWGVGPMVGVHSSWKVAFDCSLYGDAYGALTYGQANSRTSTFSNRTNTASTTTPYTGYVPLEASIRNSLYQFSPELNFNLGLRWERNFDNDSKRARVQIGYETAYYFLVMKTIVNDMSYRVDTGSGLGVQGLVIEGRVEF